MGGKISSVENPQPSLEDVFLHITGRDVRDSVDARVPNRDLRIPEMESRKRGR
jgi:hypothetical protein